MTLNGERWARRVFPRDSVIHLYQDDVPSSGEGTGVPKSISVPPNSFTKIIVESEGSVSATSNRLYDLFFRICLNRVVKQEARHRHRMVLPNETIVHSWALRWAGPFKEGGLIEVAVDGRVPGDAKWSVNGLRLYGVN